MGSCEPRMIVVYEPEGVISQINRGSWLVLFFHFKWRLFDVTYLLSSVCTASVFLFCLAMWKFSLQDSYFIFVREQACHVMQVEARGQLWCGLGSLRPTSVCAGDWTPVAAFILVTQQILYLLSHLTSRPPLPAWLCFFLKQGYSVALEPVLNLVL